MFSSIRDRFGAAGLVVAIVALVAALAGGAYAASGGLSGKQKKETTAIAKQYAGKPGKQGKAGPAGPAGPAGSNGAKGDKGDTGDKGAGGSPGAAGAPGVSPTGTSFAGSKGSCTEGGIEYKGANTSFVCNGKEGSPWTAGGTLPSKATETGAWSSIFDGQEKSGSLIPISFTLPLADPLNETQIQNNAKLYNGEDEIGAEHEACPGTAENPQAKAGFLCVYTGASNGTASVAGIFNPSNDSFAPGAATSGAMLFLTDPGPPPGTIAGTWAVTAP